MGPGAPAPRPQRQGSCAANDSDLPQLQSPNPQIPTPVFRRPAPFLLLGPPGSCITIKPGIVSRKKKVDVASTATRSSRCADRTGMNDNPREDTERSGKAWLWKTAALACVLGLGTWLLLSVVLPSRLPDDFPNLPDLQAQNSALRGLLGDADAKARSHPNSPGEIGRLGMVYHANQFFEQAESAYRIAARLAPEDYRWPYLRALVKEESGQEKDVPDLLRKSTELKKDYAPVLQKLGDIYYKQDRLDEAGRYYGLCAAAAGEDSLLQPLFGLGRVAARRKDWNKVLEYVAPLAVKYPHIRPTHQLLLDAYEALGQAGKAAEERTRLLDQKLIVVPPIKDALMDEILALCCSSTRLLKEAGLRSRFGHPAQAIEVARQAIEIEPGDADAHHFLARTLLDTHGDNPEAVDEALQQLGEGLRLRPDDVLPLWYFAANFFEQKKTEAAVEQLGAMLARNADREDAHYYLGLLADHQGRTQEAAAHYRAALKSDPENAEAWHKLGLVLVTEGKLDEATAYFEKAVRLNPTFTLARSNLGVALAERGKMSQAMAQFEEALRLKPRDGPTHQFYAIALLKSGRTDEAAAHFREAARIKPEDAEVHYGLACALALQHKLTEAAGEAREALRLRPGYPDAQALLQKLELQIARR